MKVIAVNSSNPPDPILEEYHKIISNWAADQNNGWTYITYNDSTDLINKMSVIKSNNGEKIEELEILAHGTAFNCNGIGFTNAVQFSKQLNTINLLKDDAKIILTSCNTGLVAIPGFITVPEMISKATNKTVLGAKGYIRGTYAQNNSQCVAVHPDSPNDIPLSGATDASGRNCYKSFNSTI